MSHDVWHGRGLPIDRVLLGVLGEENPKRRGLYRFQGYGGGANECFVVDDAVVLTPDADLADAGSYFKPVPGSTCVAVTGPGAQVFVVGFFKAPTYDDASEDGVPFVGEPQDAGGPLNNVAGDKVIRSQGDAAVLLKRGGSAIVQGGSGVQTFWLRDTNTRSERSQNVRESADGFSSARGRVHVGQPEDETIAIDQYFDHASTRATRVRLRQGYVDASARRELTIANVTFTPGNVTGTMRLRETYHDDGSWVAEGPSYRWGGPSAAENAVLGKALKAFLGELLAIVEGLRVNTAWGPSTPPLPDTLRRVRALRERLDEILSRYIFLSRDPAPLDPVEE